MKAQEKITSDGKAAAGEQAKSRSSDPRSRYTRQLIKDCLLKRMETTPFTQVTVTALVKDAQINRGTFYLHYLDMEDVLEDIFSDMMSDVSNVNQHLFEGCSRGCSYPFCEKIRSDRRYRVLFLDSYAAGKLIEKMEGSKEQFITWLMQNSRLDYVQAEAIFYFQINGCLSLNRMLIQRGDADWPHAQAAVDGFIRAGLAHFLIHDGREKASFQRKL